MSADTKRRKLGFYRMLRRNFTGQGRYRVLDKMAFRIAVMPKGVL